MQAGICRGMTMAISEGLQGLRDAMLADLSRLNTVVHAWLYARQVVVRQPEVAREVSMSMDVLEREAKGLFGRARTDRECIKAVRTIVNVLRETADEFQAIEADLRKKH